jgi:DNA topoisomerase IA
MIDYAKLHVDAQLTCILEKIELIEYMRTNNTIIKTPFDKECDFYINKDSILNAYPLTNIK